MKLVFPVPETDCDPARRLTLNEAYSRAKLVLDFRALYSEPARNIKDLREMVHEVNWARISKQSGGGFCAEETAFILQPAAEGL